MSLSIPHQWFHTRQILAQVGVCCDRAEVTGTWHVLASRRPDVKNAATAVGPPFHLPALLVSEKKKIPVAIAR